MEVGTIAEKSLMWLQTAYFFFVVFQLRDTDFIPFAVLVASSHYYCLAPTAVLLGLNWTALKHVRRYVPYIIDFSACMSKIMMLALMQRHRFISCLVFGTTSCKR